MIKNRLYYTVPKLSIRLILILNNDLFHNPLQMTELLSIQLHKFKSIESLIRDEGSVD